MNSMTGFGRATGAAAGREITVEIRSLNHRFLTVRSALPDEWARLEPDLERMIRDTLSRGSVNVRAEVRRSLPRAEMERAVDRLAALHEVMARAKKKLGQSDALPLEAMLAAPASWWAEGATAPSDEVAPEILKLAQEALQGVVQSRRREGEEIAKAVRGHLASIAKRVARVKKMAPHVIKNYEKRLKERVDAALKHLPARPDQADIAREIAVFADKADVSEELQRLSHHADTMGGLLSAKEPVGRKMDFLITEMTREVSTLGAKSNHAEVSSLAVEIRTDVERIKEQSENVE